MKAERDRFEVRVCATGQHGELLDEALRVFDVEPDYPLNAMTPGQTLAGSTARILQLLEPVMQQARPDMCVVQGDTTSTLCGAMAAFYDGVRVAHVEAGRRTGDMRRPFPEEMNRILVTRLASLHFAATEGAARNLAAEGVDSAAVHVTGNTGIDALLYVRDRLCRGDLPGTAVPV